MSKRKRNETVSDDGTYVVKKTRKFNIIAFVLCVLIAFIIWLYASSLENKKKEETNDAPETQVAMVAELPRGL